MSLREIRDEHGKVWQVFEVHSELASQAGALNQTYVSGWLCFLSDKGRRRIAPIPAGWEDMSDHSLRRLLAVAPPTGTGPRSQ